MLIERNSRWARVYFWSLDILDEAAESSHSYRLRDRTDLCHFFRTIFVYMPLTLLCNLLFWAMVVFFLYISPVLLFGTWKAPALQFGIITVVALLVWVCLFMGDKLAKWRYRRPERRHERRQRSAENKLRIIREWLRAKKEKVCPLVEFVDSATEEKGDGRCVS